MVLILASLCFVLLLFHFLNVYITRTAEGLKRTKEKQEKDFRERDNELRKTLGEEKYKEFQESMDKAVDEFIKDLGSGKIYKNKSNSTRNHTLKNSIVFYGVALSISTLLYLFVKKLIPH
jgi:hypothetical protein